ncbi:YlqD family protein [Roseofilum capinflatum]|uniref:YlqD family protein n=1 Tax=Roseofilum capinflatum BLCC-M114 TaxID=3022440 RepID=A0ABT7B321_9CYAN|nr:YlqD family protein [Roseofilum capinflatum]MDJ1173545.1 YlqD family protein [Roseofilum capinflatum BLCC-M114]
MDTQNLLLKRPVRIKVIVTPRWKEEVQEQLQNQLNQMDGQIQQVEVQGQSMITNMQNQNPQQVSQIQGQLNQKKNELLQQKNQLLNQLNQVQTLELDREVDQGQMDSFFTITPGENLIQKMQVEIVLRDGVVEEIRGQI